MSVIDIVPLPKYPDRAFILPNWLANDYSIPINPSTIPDAGENMREIEDVVLAFGKRGT